MPETTRLLPLADRFAGRVLRALGAAALWCAAVEAQPPVPGSATVTPIEQSGSADALSRPLLPQSIDKLTVTATDDPPRLLILGDDVARALGLAVVCPRCASDDRWALPPTSNAPWSAGVSTNVSIGATSIGVALLGSRNYRMPRFMAQPLGSRLDTTPTGASAYSDLSSNRTEWLVSVGARRTLKTFSGGQTLGVVGEAWLPLPSSADLQRAHTSLPAPSPRTDIPLLPSRAVRAGITFGF